MVSSGQQIQRAAGWGQRSVSSTETSQAVSSGWRSPEGTVGQLFVNPTDETRTISIQVDTRNLPSSPRYNVDSYRSGKSAEFKPLWCGVTLPREFTAEIAPWQLLFLKIPPQDKP